MLRLLKKSTSVARLNFVGEQALASQTQDAVDGLGRSSLRTVDEKGISGMERASQATPLRGRERARLQGEAAAPMPDASSAGAVCDFHFRAFEGVPAAANGRGVASSGSGMQPLLAHAWFVAHTGIREFGLKIARMGQSVLRDWARRYAVALGVTAALHAALFLVPSGDGASGKVAGGDAAADEGMFVLLGASSASADASNGGAQAGSAEDAAPPMSAEAISAAVSALASGELEQFQADAMARAEAFDSEVFAGTGADGGFDALAGARTALAGGGLGRSFGDGAFSLARIAGAGGGRAGRLGAGMAAIFMPEPFYPELARRERREGVVELNVVIGGSGRASTVVVTKSSGHEDLDTVARATVLNQWRFARAAAGDGARQCVVMVEFNLRRG